MLFPSTGGCRAQDYIGVTCGWRCPTVVREVCTTTHLGTPQGQEKRLKKMLITHTPSPYNVPIQTSRVEDSETGILDGIEAHCSDSMKIDFSRLVLSRAGCSSWYIASEGKIKVTISTTKLWDEKSVGKVVITPIYPEFLRGFRCSRTLPRGTHWRTLFKLLLCVALEGWSSSCLATGRLEQDIKGRATTCDSNWKSRLIWQMLPDDRKATLIYLQVYH